MGAVERWYINVMKSLEGLNERQKEAAMHTDGPLLIVAGAGAGKTKTLMARMAHLMESGVPGGAILGITFTNKAAGEMRERIRALVPQPLGGEYPILCTFHSLGVKILRKEFRSANLPSHFSILDDDDRRARVKDAARGEGLDPKEIPLDLILHIISREKLALSTPEELEYRATRAHDALAARVWRRYAEMCRREGVLDFDDLLVETVRLLLRPDMAEKYQKIFRYIHVDEYQDTSDLEYRLIRLLVGENENLCVVGDADQNIYSWRGANIENIIRFERDFRGAKTVFLEENYRSTKTILDLANAVIAKNTVRIPKNLFTSLPDGEQAVYTFCRDEIDEGNAVAEEALTLMHEGIPYEEMAVLYRTNFQSRAIEEAMLSHGIPYQVVGVRFFERKEVKDVIAYIRAALNPAGLSDIKRILNTPPRGLGKVALAKIFAGAVKDLPLKAQAKINSFYALLSKIAEKAKTSKPSETVRYTIIESGLREMLLEDPSGEERLLNIEELATLAARYDHLPAEEGIRLFLDEAVLRSDQDELEEKNARPGVRLMTVHAAKGLEFEAVFVVGMEDGLFPHSRGAMAEKLEDREEERRLFYVALTRGKKRLYLSSARTRTLFGKREFRVPSEFLSDLPPHLIKSTTTIIEDEEEETVYV